MQKLRIPLLRISFLLAFFVISCGSNPVRELPKTAVTQKNYVAPYFSDAGTDYVYKTNISVYGNELSGIFIAKKLNDSVHRLVFTTEFGNKLLDFEIGETTFKVNSIVDELDQKILINTLKEDFRLLLRSDFAVQQQFETAEDVIYESKDGSKFNYLYVFKSDAKLRKIVHSSKRNDKINLIFSSENNIFAEKITIQHLNMKLKIELNYLINQ